YDEFLIPALHLAEMDRHRNRIDAERQQFVYRTIRAIVEELGELKIETERQAVRAAAQGEQLPAGMKEGLEEEGRAPRSLAHEFTIVCAPARDEADELAAMMFAQVLASKDFRAEYVGTSRLAGEIVNDLRTKEADVVCISALPPGAVTHAR